MSTAGLFVTGTGTNVGKTIVAAVLARTASEAGRRVGVFKPVVSGLDDPGEPDHALLRRAAASAQSDDDVAPYRYGPPLSPHLAAELAGEQIDPGRLRGAASAAAAAADLLVVEGVGGLLVPLTPTYLVRDFARDLALPVVISALPGLGTINHTLLTVEATRAAGLTVAGIVLTPWPTEPGTLERSNLESIAALAQVRVETLARLDPDSPARWPKLTF